MRIYFDTSAVVPLVLEEEGTKQAQEVWAACTEAWAWDWMRVEAEAALARRQADPTAWAAWRSVESVFHLVGLASEQHDSLRAFNRGLGLRAADAGHLFLFDRLLEHRSEFQLFTLDQEMHAAARRIGLPLVRN